MSELVPGGNLPLPGGPLTVRVPGPFDVSALITDDDGRVRGDGDFVFYNQPTAPGAVLHGDTLTVDPRRLRAGATRVTVVVSPADPGTPLGRLPVPTLFVTDPGGRPLARFTPPRPAQETVLLLAELYRRGADWKVRALGQGYADGLAGLARDFGVDVVDDDTPSSVAADTRAAPTGPAHAPTATTGPAHPPAAPTGPVHAPRPATAPHPPSAPAPDPHGCLPLINTARARAGSPPVSLDARLTTAAQQHASAMAVAGRLGVESPDGVAVYQRVTAAGYPYITIGEHLVSGPRTPTEFIDYCLRTDGPRRTLHDPAFTHAGLAHANGGRSGDTYWTALWASPLTQADLTRTAADVIDLTNHERAHAGLPPLGPDPVLAGAAQAHSADMVARDFYSHTAPDGRQPWDRAAAAGSTRRSIGENIACGQRSPTEVVTGWMNSPGHRANILKPGFTHIGIGFACGGRAGTYWTQLFGGG
ncbi:CAP domain-containing protein [Streptomyces sp. TRM70350]|uniref:CAP domain-containing protein n=1 Tax=Streptomyces sp. TRM70350 TaxID=2856165 RepID=UPI001C4395AB|nr:CAP domain-containing protein [Streptomyces sp. TRM70350]MBV7699782.1 TerD family protein [Streptomyces sp. TRM70350]